jgi:hypothetical protein
MKKLLKITLFFLSVTLFACGKKDNEPAHPLAGEWKLKNVESKQYLAFTDDAKRPAFDIGRGNSNVMKVLSGPKPGQYYVVAKENIDMYLSTTGSIYTYIMATTFSNSDTDLFTFVPISEGSDRYHIQSVADPSSYLVSCYTCYGRSSTLGIRIMDPNYWDSIWILEKP